MKRLVDRNVLAFWPDKDARLEAAYVLDKLDICRHTGVSQVTAFLSQTLHTWCAGIVREQRFSCLAVGGFPESERVRLLIGMPGTNMREAEARVGLLWVCPDDPAEKLEHRQLLGSLLGLGLKREVIGDIRPGHGGMYVAVTEEVIPFIVQHWAKAGRSGIKVEISLEPPQLHDDEGEELRLTVASLRLDAIISGGFGVSRSQAQELISQGRVKRNDLVVVKSAQELKPGDTVSCRGKGRLRLMTDEGLTRKGRVAVRALVWRTKRP